MHFWPADAVKKAMVQKIREIASSDPVLKAMANYTEGELNYLAAQKFFEKNELTDLARLILVPTLLINATVVRQSRGAVPVEDVLEVKKSEELVELLKSCIVKGANICCEPLEKAMRFSFASAQLLQAAGINMSNTFAPSNMNLFHIAGLGTADYERMILLAFEAGANPNLQCAFGSDQPNFWNNTPLQDLISNERWTEAGILVTEAVERSITLDFTKKDQEGKNTLHLIAKMNEHRALHYFRIEHKKHPTLFEMDYTATDKTGKTGLHYGCLYKNPETIYIFLAGGCDMNQPDNSGKTPLDYLIVRNPALIKQSFAEVAIDVDRPYIAHRNGEERPANIPYKSIVDHCLSDISLSGSTRVILRYGSNIPQEKLELLFRNVAVRSGNSCCLLAMLLDRVAIDASGASGNTALHVAARSNNSVHINWLLAHGATSLENTKGKTPQQLARGEAKGLFDAAPAEPAVKETSAPSQ